MPINEKDIVVGGIYKTPNSQLRRVIEIKKGKVSWECKSENYQARPWRLGHTKASPSPIAKFAKDCSEINFKP